MATDQDAAAKGHETTPLLSRELAEERNYGKSVLYRALFCGFLVSLSFGVTQVPLVYVFRLMTCEAYYKEHSEPGPGSDRCGNPEIEAGTARAVALLGASTTLFGVVNLFVTGWTMKKLGIKSALLISVFWPAVRLAVQNIGVMVGGDRGIIIVQSSQIITVLGGPAGYLLSLNSYVAEIVKQGDRTGALGKLQGCSFIGTAIAYLAGGVISDAFGIIAPFRVTVMLFLTSCLYVILFLPRLQPIKGVANQHSNGLIKFFGPLKIFIPQKWILRNGRAETEYGTILLGAGVFLGVLATGYIPVLLQMYATDVYDFGTTENGYLISLNSFVRGMFLTIAFPRIISTGRKWLSYRDISKDIEAYTIRRSMVPSLPNDINTLARIEGLGNDEEITKPSLPKDKIETFEFDLQYARYSLLGDALLTGAASFVCRGWQLYLVAILLPFAAGTGSAAKGTILQMCPATERSDALSAISLIEMVARLATTSVFGFIFAAFAQIEKTYLIFTCNSVVALFGSFILLFAQFPPDGSKRFEDNQACTDSQTT